MSTVVSAFGEITVRRRTQTKSHTDEMTALWARCAGCSAAGRVETYFRAGGQAGLPLPGGDGVGRAGAPGTQTPG